jgi:hypothetical protein
MLFFLLNYRLTDKIIVHSYENRIFKIYDISYIQIFMVAFGTLYCTLLLSVIMYFCMPEG